MHVAELFGADSARAEFSGQSALLSRRAGDAGAVFSRSFCALALLAFPLLHDGFAAVVADELNAGDF